MNTENTDTMEMKTDIPTAGEAQNADEGANGGETTKTAEMLAKYIIARRNLGIMIVLTLINMLLTFIGSHYGFAFAAFLPDMFIALAKGGDHAAVNGILYAFAIGMMLAFGASWLFCIVRPWWFVFALLLFLADSFAMFKLTNGIEDFPWISAAFHIWILYYLFSGISSGFKLKRHICQLEKLQEEAGHEC